MPRWLLLLLVIVILVLFVPGLLVKGLSFLLYIAFAIVIVWLIIAVIKALTNRRR